VTIGILPSAAPAAPWVVPFRVEGSFDLKGNKLVGHRVATQATRVSIRVRPLGGRTPLFAGSRSLQTGDTTIHLTLSRDGVRRLHRLTRRSLDVRLVGQGPLANQTIDAPAVPVTFSPRP
jgi:hypothetical protein